jgi:hypothetical protein
MDLHLKLIWASAVHHPKQDLTLTTRNRSKLSKLQDMKKLSFHLQRTYQETIVCQMAIVILNFS